MVFGLDVGTTDQIDFSGVGHDQFGTTAQAALHARGKDGVRVAGVGADHQDYIGLFDRLEGLCAGRGAEGLSQAITGG